MAKNPETEETEISWKKSLVLYLHDWIYMLAVIIILLLLFFRVVVVSGPSMYSTLWDGDWLLLVSNMFYQEPEIGDIIVACQDTYNDGEAIVKRVIAKEGQQVDIDFAEGIVYVDGVALEEDYIYTPTNMAEGMIFPLEVDEGCIFVLGDNRNKSKDSRSMEIGLIDKREVLGKAVFLMFPGKDEFTEERLFSRIGVLN
ncbi:MAG: signal peptidase I [Oscillospiraceae bacterium]|nr:signal peptidase I [Oscillospiraceae bacterium]